MTDTPDEGSEPDRRNCHDASEGQRGRRTRPESPALQGRQGGFMAGLELGDAQLQVPITSQRRCGTDLQLGWAAHGLEQRSRQALDPDLAGGAAVGREFPCREVTLVELAED